MYPFSSRHFFKCESKTQLPEAATRKNEQRTSERKGLIYVYGRVFFFLQKQPRRCSIKKDVLKDFAKFTGNQLCWSLFLQAFGPATLLKKRSRHRCFPVNLFEIFKNTFFTEHLHTTASISFF